MHRTTTPTRHVRLPLAATMLVAALTAAVVLVLAATAHAATPLVSTGDGSWVWQRPLPQGNDLDAIAFADDLHGWAVGRAGTIIRSTDGGASWAGARSGTGADLRAVGSADAQTAWVVGAAGTLLATTDGGATWTPQDAGVVTDLDAVAALTPQRAWVAGVGGVVLQTHDGGATWIRQATGSVADLHAVEFVNATDGWVSGDGGTLLHTADGGATWTAQDWATSLGYPVDQADQVDISELSFVDADTGWAFGGWRLAWWDTVLMHTTDGGGTWTAIAPFSLNPELVSDIEFVDPQHGWAVTQQDGTQPYYVVEVFRTSDAGTTWTRGWGDGMEADEFSPPFPVSLAVCGEKAWLAGSLGRLARTLDGWSWSPTTANHRNRLTAVAFADASTGWAAGSGHEFAYGWYSTLLKTTDGGADWSATAIPDCGPLFGVACYGSTGIVAVGYGGISSGNGNVAYSRDGGTTWSDAGAGGGQLSDVDLVSADRGWAVGRAGGVYRTDDGGASWRYQTSGSSSDLEGVDFVDDDGGWVVGAAGTILRTIDGGATWETQSVHTPEALRDVAFGDRLSGWVVGDDGTALHTSDGGLTWVATDVGTSVDLHGVAVAGSTVRVAGTRGTVIVSRDAGATWRREALGTDNDLVGLAMIGGGDAWVVSHDGGILATSAVTADVTAPATSDDAPAGWVNRSVTVTLSASDAESGVAGTEYRLDGGDWTSGAEIVVAAPADHTGDGVHTIVYRSVDAAGNVEAAHTCAVRIDTRAPSLAAPRLVVVRHGRPAAIAVTALDAPPNGGSVTVTAAGVRTSRRHPWSASATTAPGGTATLTLPTGLPRGAYRVRLAARDTAGNAAATLTVLLIVR